MTQQPKTKACYLYISFLRTNENAFITEPNPVSNDHPQQGQVEILWQSAEKYWKMS